MEKDLANTFEYYKKAPIILAIIQIRYEKIREFDTKLIRNIGVNISKEFPQVNESWFQTVKLDSSKVKGETSVSLAGKEINGVVFTSEDRTKQIVIGNERFTYEYSGSYPGWEEFKNKMKEIWELFRNDLDVKLLGASTRFINKINLPKDTKDLKDYFTTYIHSDTGEHYINTFQLKYTSFEGENLVVHIGHALEPALNDSLPYIFDIDVVHVENLDNDSKLWDIFESLRFKKDFIFNDAITEKTKNLIR
jgi:uncharacterized protein (TIGR04255 family)